MQISGLVQPSSAQNWVSSQGSSSGLIVKQTMRVDIPVDQYPNVLLDSIFLVVISQLGFPLKSNTTYWMLDFAVQFCWTPPWS